MMTLLVLGVWFCAYSLQAQTFQMLYSNDSILLGSYGTQTADGGYILTGHADDPVYTSTDIFLVKANSVGDTVWSKTYGDAAVDLSSKVMELGNGDYIVCGNSSSDLYMLRVDANGNVIWSKNYGGVGSDGANDCQPTSDGGFIAVGYTFAFGAGNRDFYVVKTNGNGDLEWAKAIGGPDFDNATAVVQTSDNGFLVLGDTKSYGAGNFDVYLVKLDNSGTIMWTKTYGDTEAELAKSILVTPAGDILITGYTQSANSSSEPFLLKLSDDGTVLWLKIYGTEADFAQIVKQTADGGYIIAGFYLSFGLPGMEVQNAILIKTDANGTVEWSGAYGGSGNDRAFNVEESTDGGYLLFGTVQTINNVQDWDTYLVKTDATGWVSCNYAALSIQDQVYTFLVGAGGTAVSGGSESVPATVIVSKQVSATSLCSGCPLSNAFTTTVIDTSMAFASNSTSADTWYWDFGDGSSDTVQSGTHEYTTTGVYQVCLTVADTCNSDTLCKSITISLTGEEELTPESLLRIYPNPSTGVFTLEFSEAMNQPALLKVFNVLGEEVLVEWMAPSNGNSQRLIDLSDMGSGLYVIQLETSTGMIGKKVMIR